MFAELRSQKVIETLLQLLQQPDVADEDVDHVHVILEQVAAHEGFGAPLLFVTVLQVGHRR